MNQSQFAAKGVILSGTKLAPLRESDGSVALEIVSGVEMSFLIEEVVDGGMNGGEFLQTSHLPETEHGPFSSSKQEM